MTARARGPVGVPTTSRSRFGAVALLGGRTVLALLSVAVLALTCYGWYFVNSANSGVTTTDVFDGANAAEPLDGAVDILLVGMDSRTDAQGNPLPREVLDMLHAGDDEGDRQTDTMILVHIPQDGTSATAISFPRDSWVELAGGYGSNRLNSAFRFAYNDTVDTLTAQGETDADDIERQAEVEGRKNLIATIEQLLGRPGMIDRYAEVNLASFYEVTKALDGIEVCLNQPAKEYKSGIDLPAGVQTIKGVQALAFVRQRHGLLRGDLDRIARQQAFLSGLARKMLSGDVLLNPERLGEVLGAVQKSVIVSKDWDLLEFANQMRNLSGGQIEFHTMPVVGNARIGGADVLEVDTTQVRAFVDELVPQDSAGDPRMETAPETVPGAENYAVDIYNATGDPTLADDARALLAGQGFGGESYATTDPVPSTVIHHAAGEQEGAELLRQGLGSEFAVEVDPSLPSGTLALTMGTDFTLPPGAHGGAERLTQGDGMQSLLSGAAPRQPQDDREQGDEAPGEQTSDDAGNGPITAGGVPCVN